ncbi:hypothetical protein HYH02_009904 [Chlamydomonas schloesseri]|uniref:Uncharacterized protein n=1 Tax=Chlamydomonas schloesseri TaxID=2026947 RepID=A0A835W9E7_9CHLO|nr:hypothetical protein HYH02_009904 [Chlamydomonas schloesseri]|eukprot:KAG2441311.1 hypothetical protein HYH02_009904 [Chlamydomonas schloesseri]
MRRSAAQSTKFRNGRDSSNQTATFLADLAKGKLPRGGGSSGGGKGATRRISLSWFAANDISVVLEAALLSGRSPAAAGAEVVPNLVACLVQHARALAAAGVAEVVLFPQSPLQTSPLVPEVFRPFVAGLVDQIDVALARAVAALNAQLEAQALAAAPAGSAAATPPHVYLLGDSKWMGRLLSSIQPPFKYTTGVHCLRNPAPMSLGANVTICERPNDYAFYDGLHPTTFYHRWFALQGLLPRLQLFRLAPRDV